MSRTTPPLQWSDAFLLGFAEMDATHREFAQVVADLQRADAATVGACLRAAQAHAQAHFAQEDVWMNETDFPPRDCHIDEHAAVLNSIAEVRERLEAASDATTELRLVHSLADELARWFPGHADYLDSALSHWMCKRRLGGKPVVIRRGLNLQHST